MGTELDFSASSKPSDTQLLNYLKKSKNVKSLNISGCNTLNAQGVSYIAKIDRLKVFKV